MRSPPLRLGHEAWVSWGRLARRQRGNLRTLLVVHAMLLVPLSQRLVACRHLSFRSAAKQA